MPETKRCCEEGTIFYTSWGYEQTNVDFYEVIHSTEKMVTVRELEKATAEDNGQFTGRAVPLKGKYRPDSKPIKRKLDTNHFGKPMICISSFQLAGVWDSKPKAFSTYA